MAMSKQEKILVSYRFSPPFVERLKKRAKYERRSMTTIVEFAVNLYIHEQEDNSLGSAEEQPRAKGSRL